MYPVQIMMKGKWTRFDGLKHVRKGNVFRVLEGPNQWGLPRAALAHPTFEKHPKDQSKGVYCVLFKCGDTQGQLYEPLRNGRAVK